MTNARSQNRNFFMSVLYIDAPQDRGRPYGERLLSPRPGRVVVLVLDSSKNRIPAELDTDVTGHRDINPAHDRGQVEDGLRLGQPDLREIPLHPHHARRGL